MTRYLKKTLLFISLVGLAIVALSEAEVISLKSKLKEVKTETLSATPLNAEVMFLRR